MLDMDNIVWKTTQLNKVNENTHWYLMGQTGSEQTFENMFGFILDLASFSKNVE